MSDTDERTIDEALSRFALIAGAGDGAKTACAMTALSWVAGEAWSDSPSCAHPILSRWAIRANDDPTTTEAERADIVRAGATGIIDTWWVPAEVLLLAWSETPTEHARPARRMVAIAERVAAWKASVHEGADLGGAYLGGAYLRGADLRGADLRGAYLRGADLRGADLRGAYSTSLTVWPAGVDPSERGVKVLS